MSFEKPFDASVGYFVFKLLTKYLLYAYLCLFGGVVCVCLCIVWYRYFCFPYQLGSFFFAFCALPLFFQFAKILITTPYKYRYYKIYLYRLKTRGYKDEYFEDEMHEPCFRLIIKDVLFSYGLKNEYFELCQKCKGKNMKVQNAKEALLRKVQQKYAT